MEQRFVAFLDVLGFSDFVRHSDHEDVLSVYQNLLLMVAHMTVTGGKYRHIDDGTHKGIMADLEQARANLLIVSDSIVVYSNAAGMKDFINVLLVTYKMLSLGFFVGLPLRGAMTTGPLSVIQHRGPPPAEVVTQSLVGRCLVDAFALEHPQQWSGALVSDEAIDVYRHLVDEHRDVPDLATIDYLVDTHLLARYAVPWETRDGAVTREAWTIAWPWAEPTRPSDNVVRNAFGQHNKNATLATRKIENTLRYLNEIRPPKGEVTAQPSA
jgi:hypothetical protein